MKSVISGVTCFIVLTLCNLSTGSQDTSQVVTKYLELQQQRKRKSGKNCMTIRNKSSVKTSRRVRVGWKHRIAMERYKVMSIKEGGGMQVMDFEKDITLHEATEKIVSVYFPHGQSLNFKIEDVDYYIASFSNQKLGNLSSTVGDYFQNTISHPVRWYLHTSLKVCIYCYDKTK